MADLHIHLPRLSTRSVPRRGQRAETELQEPRIGLWPGAARVAIILGGAGLGWGVIAWLFRLATS